MVYVMKLHCWVFQNASSLSKQTALAWSTDYSCLAIGSDDGFVFFTQAV